MGRDWSCGSRWEFNPHSLSYSTRGLALAKTRFGSQPLSWNLEHVHSRWMRTGVDESAWEFATKRERLYSLFSRMRVDESARYFAVERERISCLLSALILFWSGPCWRSNANPSPLFSSVVLVEYDRRLSLFSQIRMRGYRSVRRAKSRRPWPAPSAPRGTRRWYSTTCRYTAISSTWPPTRPKWL